MPPLPLNNILVGDVVEKLKELPDGCVQVVVTSPPYFGHRDYQTGSWEGGDPGCDHSPSSGIQGKTGQRANRSFTAEKPQGQECGHCGASRKDRQIGLEAIPDCLAWARGEPPCGRCYVCRLREVFAEVRRVLRDDGVLFLNLGDSYAASGRGGGGGSLQEEDVGRKIGGENQRRKALPGFKPKDLMGIPWRVAFALQQDGWYLRNDIVWAKDQCMPESVTDRCTRSHEFIFHFAKNKTYLYDAFAIREPVVEKGRSSGNKERLIAKEGERNRTNDHLGSSIPWTDNGHGRNKRSVWTMNTDQFSLELCSGCGRVYNQVEHRSLTERGEKKVCRCGKADAWVSHFAVFPEDLPAICILAGTSEKGCCPACGAPWARVLKRESVSPKDYNGKWSAADKQAASRRVLANVRGAREAGGPHDNPFPEPVSAGWEPGCKCGIEETVPCVVLDPFLGSGTSALVALNAHRYFIGIELNPSFAALAEKRIEAEKTQARLF